MLDTIDTLDNWYCVYQHIFPDGKQYFGMTKAYPPSRWGKNGIGYRCNKEMTDAIMKCGWENVEHHIIQRNLTYEEACALEEALIVENRTYDLEFGYNDFIGHIRGRRSLISQSMAQTGKRRVCSEKQLAQLKRLHQYNTGRHRGKGSNENVG